ncbi:hypothetical protein PROFUN_16947, partial [Planoprotostelium fungivorum]
MSVVPVVPTVRHKPKSNEQFEYNKITSQVFHIGSNQQSSLFFIVFFWLAILNGDQHSSHIELTTLPSSLPLPLSVPLTTPTVIVIVIIVTMSDHISRPEYDQELFNLQAELEALDARILKIRVSRKDENAKAQRQELLDERQDLLENMELVIQLRDSARVASASALKITPPSNGQVEPELKPEPVESATAKDSTRIPSNLPSFMDSMGKGRPVYQDPIQFTRMFESTLKANGLPADHHWERLFEISVNNDRYLWAQANAFNRNLTWKDFTKLFHDHYNQPGLKRRIKAQLFKMTMHDEETVLQFGDRFKGLM